MTALHDTFIQQLVRLVHKEKEADVKEMQDLLKADEPESSIMAIVLAIKPDRIVIVMNQYPDLKMRFHCRITQLANELPYERMLNTLEQFKRAEFCQTPLRRVLLGLQMPSDQNDLLKDPLTLFDSNLNGKQREAVVRCLRAAEICLIHGPPGTGKTQTLVEVIRHLASKGQKVLVCGPSHVSVDNLVERLKQKAGIRLVRIGHSARMSPDSSDVSLDRLIREGPDGAALVALSQRIDKLTVNLEMCTCDADREKVYGDIKRLRADLFKLETKAAGCLLQLQNVVCSTLSGTAGKHVNRMHFGTVVIDECTQSIEPDCWIALTRASKAVLAGDPMQLPPTVKSEGRTFQTARFWNAEECFRKPQLTFTLFDRLVLMYGDNLKCLLSVQYRMHSDIMTFSNVMLYQGKLTADQSVAQHKLIDVKAISRTAETLQTLVLMDTAQDKMRESTTEDSLDPESKFNRGEAKLACHYVAQLVKLIKGLLESDFPDVSVITVDAVQGQEKEAVILSLVRSNEHRSIGFLQEKRRLNVAITRAKRHLCIICDSRTLSSNTFCDAMVEYMRQRGQVRSEFGRCLMEE
ncbi:hypothetical protein RI367_001370 [Sorochytrium milnesiophthora]